MVVFPGMLVEAATRAGMAVPDDPDKFEDVKDEYPHFFVLLRTPARATGSVG